MLRPAAFKQKPFSICHNRRQTSRSHHTAVRRCSNAAQWVQPGTAHVYPHYHVTVTLRLNSFPPSFKNWHTVRAGLSGFTLLHRCKRRKVQYVLLKVAVGRRCVKPSLASRPQHIFHFQRKTVKSFLTRGSWTLCMCRWHIFVVKFPTKTTPGLKLNNT